MLKEVGKADASVVVEERDKVRMTGDRLSAHRTILIGMNKLKWTSGSFIRWRERFAMGLPELTAFADFRVGRLRID